MKRTVIITGATKGLGREIALAFGQAGYFVLGLYASDEEAAAELKVAFNRDFWLEDKGWLAMGLDRDKKPIDALSSNMGHCLWTGILDADKADLVAKKLGLIPIQQELFK